MCMKFTCVDLIEVMYGRPRVNLKVEPHSTFLSTLLSIHCLYFSYIREFYIHTWKSCDSGNQPYFLSLTFAYSIFFLAPTYPQASVVQPCVSTGVVTFPEEQTQTPVVHPTHILEPQSYDEHHTIRNAPMRRGLSQEDILER